MDKAEILDRMRRARVLVRVATGEDARRAIEAGADAVEFGFSAGLDAVPRLVRDQAPGLPGIGEIAAAEQAWEAVEAGARFLTATGLTQEIAAVGEAAGVPVVAAVESEAQLQEALPLRPDLLLMPDRRGIMAPLNGPGALYQLEEADEESMFAAAARGAVGIAVAWTSETPGSQRDLELLIERVEAAFQRS